MIYKPDILAQEFLPSVLKVIPIETVIGLEEWERVKAETIKNAACHCEACGENVDNENELICHVRYVIHKLRKIVEIVGFSCVCKKCYDYMHLGETVVAYAMGKIDHDYMHYITQRGNEMLSAHGMERNTLSFRLMNNEHWRFMYKGRLCKINRQKQ